MYLPACLTERENRNITYTQRATAWYLIAIGKVNRTAGAHNNFTRNETNRDQKGLLFQDALVNYAYPWTTLTPSCHCCSFCSRRFVCSTCRLWWYSRYLASRSGRSKKYIYLNCIAERPFLATPCSFHMANRHILAARVPAKVAQSYWPGQHNVPEQLEVRISGEKNGSPSRMQIISAALNATKIQSQ